MKNLIKFSLLPLLFIVGCERKNIVISEEQAKQIDDLVNGGMISGLQLAYFDKNNDFTYTSGHRKLEDSSAVNDATIFESASLSSLATALLTLKLADEGIVELHQPIAEIFRYERLAEDPYYFKITFAHLLSHTSGLPNWSPDTLYLGSIPGLEWQYSTEGYVLLAKALEEKLGTPFGDLCRKWVFEPLQLTRSEFVWKDEFASNVATGHTDIDRAVDITKYEEANAGFSLYTTASDYSKLLQATAGDFLQNITIDSLTSMVQPIMSWDGTPTGLGWSYTLGVQQGESSRLLWHWGDNLNFKSLAIMDANSNKGLVFFTNSANGLSIARELVGTFFQESMTALDWLDYPSYKEQDHQLAIQVKKTFYWQDSSKASSAYLDMISAGAKIDDNLMNNTVWSFFEMKELRKAATIVEAHLAQFPESSEAWARKGEVLGFDHRYQESWLAYQKAMELDPEISKTILPRFPWYQEANRALNDRAQRLDLSRYAGQYGSIVLRVENGELLYSDEYNDDIPLYRLSNKYFDLTNLETYRIEFSLSPGGPTAVTRSHLTGLREKFDKI